MTLKEYKEKKMQDPEFAQAYSESQLELSEIRALIDNRTSESDNRINNASMDAIHDARAVFAGEAGRLGLIDEQDIVDMVKEIRAEKKARA